MVMIEKLKLAPATHDHYRPLLEISRGIYDGLDYFSNVYHVWVDQEKEDPRRRRNVVLLDENEKVIGYQSFMFQDGGRRVVAQALRIDLSLKGLGVGKRFMELCREFLLDINKEVMPEY